MALLHRGRPKRPHAEGARLVTEPPADASREIAPRFDAPSTGSVAAATLARMASVRPQPLLAVRDVCASARWYATLLGGARTSEQMASDHGHLYDRLLVGGELVLQLHAWNREDHANLVDPDGGRNGHGVLVWFELDDLDAAVARARAMQAEVVEEVHVNPAPRHRELWLRDPDGYLVVLCSPDGEAG